MTNDAPDYDVNEDCGWCYAIGYAIMMGIGIALMFWAARGYR